MNQNMPPVVKNLLIINFLMYLGKVVAMRYGIDLDAFLGLHFFLASDFKLYQLFTYMFVHGNLMHIFFNMFTLWMFGRIMEQVMGSQRFLFYYVVCGLGAGIVQEGVQYLEYVYQGLAAYSSVNIGGGVTVPMATYLNTWATVGASGAIYGILLSFGMTFPEERMFIIPFPFPIKAKWFVMGFTVIELLSALGNRGDGVAHMAHLGGMLFGLVLILYWRNHPGGGSNRFFGGGTGGHGGFGGSGSYFTRYEDVTNTTSRQGFGAGIRQWFIDLQGRWQKLFRRKPKMNVRVGGKHSADMEWNLRKKEREAEMDRILDKVKRGGYDSLTTEEKRTLFESSND